MNERSMVVRSLQELFAVRVHGPEKINREHPPTDCSELEFQHKLISLY
jgi:hypothetical protein